MISWMTSVILSAPRMSTRGRAPWLRAIMRFWISVESLNRPPTLLTIFSSFSSSSIEKSTSAALRFQDRSKFLDTTVEVVVDQLDVVPVRLGELLAGLAEAPEGRGLGLRTAAAEALFKGPERRCPDEHEQGARGMVSDLERLLHLDLQDDRSSLLKGLVNRTRGA